MIELHPEKKMPLYEQLYNALAQDIRSGALQPGKALPGRRTMAAQLGISTNTVDTAYQMLAAEGLAVTRPRSGFFVQETGGMLHTRPQHSVVPAPKATPKNTVSNQDDILYDLSTGSIDTSLFPARSWGRIQKELMYQRPELLQRGDMQGDENLRAQIAAYLGEYRGVDCTADQVVVGAGVEYLLGCLAHLFAGSTAAVENPGYSRTRAVLENNGIPCVPVEIDESGLPIRALEQSGANLCYVTPSHHFPTGVTMPAPRRAQLLAWAAAKPGRFILEDDYDSEFRFATRPLPSLQGMSGANGPVVYLTTFSKSLAPGMRIACMVLPQGLLERYQSDFSMYANTVSRYEQQTLCEFMANGYFARHIARMRLTYKRRMEAFAAALPQCKPPVCYNGDITTTGQLHALEAEFPTLSGIMIGRGIIADPALFRKALGGPAATKAELRGYLDDLYHGYTELFGSAGCAISRMKGHWFYLIHCFADSEKLEKQLKKLREPWEYEVVVNQIFTLPLVKQISI